MAPPVVQVHLTESTPVYRDTDEAASRALSPLRNALAKIEQTGAILQGPDGRFALTDSIPTTEHGGAMGIAHPGPGWKLAGLYHDHTGQGKEVGIFSDTDVEQANRFN